MVRPLEDTEEKRACIRRILSALPDWFGEPKALEKFVEVGADSPMYVYWKQDQIVGFVCVRPTSESAAEVYVMGVLPAYRHRGIGRLLIRQCEDYCRRHKLPLLHVKTLDHRIGDPDYLETYAFYRAMGFLPLEVLPLWDAQNPCLLMVKNMEE